MMEKLEKEILVLLCKVENFFPHGVFNRMRYLLIHLSYEAKVSGLVQYILNQWLAIEQGLKGASLKHLHLRR
jgi:hypothetical protein